jgi:hypothetical protein
MNLSELYASVTCDIVAQLEAGTVRWTKPWRQFRPANRFKLEVALVSSSSYAAYHNEARTHRSLNKGAPFHRPIQRLGATRSQPILSGLHHQYCRIWFSVHSAVKSHGSPNRNARKDTPVSLAG